ncbi:MAG: phage portal protein [Alphaproteobacteria bacterium]
MALSKRLGRLLGLGPDTPPEQKASAVSRVMVHRPGAPVWTPRRYETLAQEGYRINPIAYKCVRLIAASTARLPWVVFREKHPLNHHPLLDLLTRPNPMSGGQLLREALFSHYLTAGNAYLEAVVGQSGPVQELFVLRPDRMKIVPGNDGARGYVYSVGGRQHTFGPRDLRGHPPILHMRTFNPLDDWYGMSPLEAAARAVDQHNEASAWNKAMLQNMGRPSGALVVKDEGGLTEQQFARLKSEMERHYQSADNAGRPLLLEGGLEWQEMGMSARDLDWLAGKDLAAREIAQVYQVPPQLIGIPDAQTYSNNREARLALYEDAVMPLADLFAESMTSWLAPFFGEDLTLSYDKDRVEALSPRRDRLYQRLAGADWLTRNEKRVATGFDPMAKSNTPVEQDDVNPSAA